MRLPLIDGQGNFGSMDGDPPAAMRYTEARLAKVADALLADIDKDTVDFRPNYDESRDGAGRPAGAVPEPAGQRRRRHRRRHGDQHPAAQSGRDHRRHRGPDRRPGPRRSRACAAIVQGPDFPTGGIILGRRTASCRPTATAAAASSSAPRPISRRCAGRTAIIVTEVPYQVNKARMVERIAEVVREKKVEGIADLRDESDRHGVRVVIEVKREADPDIVLNQLFKFTPLQTSFGINMVSLRGGRPEQLGLKEMLRGVPRLPRGGDPPPHRLRSRARRARARTSCVGLVVAVANIDEVIALIRAAADPQAAKAELMARAWPLADVAAAAPRWSRSRRTMPRRPGHGRRLPPVRRAGQGDPGPAPAAPDRARARQAHRRAEEIAPEIEELLLILRSRERLLEVMRAELLRVKELFDTPAPHHSSTSTPSPTSTSRT